MSNLQFVLTIIFCLLLRLPVHAQSALESEADNSEMIRIGLLLNEDPENNSLMQEALDAVNLAVEQINDDGGIRERKVKVFVKSVDGNWGAGSKQAVSLIFKHQVKALIGFVDGRSAHLIEQVCTKAEIPFISTLSPDPGLSKINIPWFFSTVPHADQQATALAEHLVRNKLAKNILVFTTDDYDQDFISRSFLDELANEYHITPNVFIPSSGNKDYSQTVAYISETNTETIVFFGTPGELDNLAGQLDLNHIDIPVYTSIHDLRSGRNKQNSTQVFAIRAENFNGENKASFQKLFSKKHGYQPVIHTSYLYDGTQVLLKAINEKGFESNQIQKSLIEMSGRFSFDSDGVTEQPHTVVQISGGKSQ